GELSDYDARDGRGGFSSPRTELPLDRREFSSEGCLPETRKNRRRRAMDRRGFLTRAGVVAGVAATFPAPAIAQGIRELKMVTSWPKGLPGLGSSAERLGRAIAANTGGRLKGQVFGTGQLGDGVEGF